MTATPPAHSSLPYCADQVRRHDHDRYLTGLFAPAQRREALFALYAFNIEVAKTAEIVREPMLGHIRLQWWREAVADIYAGRRPSAHPVLAPLTEAVTSHGLSRAHFDRLLDTREFDLDGTPPPTLAALEAYAAGVSASLMHLALEILGVRDEESHTAGHDVGIAWALIGLIRAVPFHARQRRLYLPCELSDAAGLRIADVFELRAPAALGPVAEAIAARAAMHLSDARARRRQVDPAARPALLAATLADSHLATLRRAGYDPFAPAVQQRAPGRIWRLIWAHLRRRY
ncbi:MAG: squalene/phytoene synthase family protein [Alphaproteobacteria bacterium]|nr:MAG: squalene/phytoene synthase family protein [Alphaproteobacteria bacterium]